MAKKPTRKRNPVPPSRTAQVNAGMDLFQRFTGHNGNLFSLMQPTMPDVGLVVGYLDGVMYTTVRDGKTEKYLHQFKKKSRPLLISSFDGTQLIILGGGYDFTERGIVDKP